MSNRPSRRLGAYLATLAHSVGAFVYPKNLKAAFRNVTKSFREYICFYLAALLMTAGFCTIALSTEANLGEAHERVEAAYDYHLEVALLNNEQYANLDAQLDYQIARANEYLAAYEWLNDGKPLPDGTYTVRITLNEEVDLATAYREVHYDMLNRVSQGRRDIRFTPLYTFEADFVTPYNAQFWTVTLVWLAFSILSMVVLFLIRLDHFRFLYGVYMTCGADFVRLIGASGGELLVITALTWVPAVLVGGGIVAALYLPAGVGLTVTLRAIVVTLGGGVLVSFISVWFPMRRLATQPPIRHLAAADTAGLVSSPRRSFYLFGQSFPGRYELYGFWRMRKYYLRLVLSAVLFAAVFVSGLYIAELVTARNSLDPYEYHLAYRPDAYYEDLANAGDPDGDQEEEEVTVQPDWQTDPEDAAMVREDLDLFIEDLEAIDGISHAEWTVAYAGGASLSHMLLTPGQLYRANDCTVPSRERIDEGFRWAANNYDYTAIDKTWIDNMIRHGLATFEGDPYAMLEKENHIIISEDIFNERIYEFAPGDRIVIAVCERTAHIDIIFDPMELLRRQIDTYGFRYETYTVAAVARDLSSEDAILLGVTYDDYATLTGTTPFRGDLQIYMENGADIRTVQDAEAKLRRLMASFSDWTVTPTGNYLKAQVKGLKQDSAVILTLAACLLLLSPMIWYFSQLLFYRKRRHEFAILHALGAPDAAFARIHRLAGGVLSGVAFAVTVLLALLCNWGVYMTVGTLLPKLHLTESLHLEFGLSLPALIACVLVSVLCGYLSCVLPYHLFVKRDIGDNRLL